MVRSSTSWIPGAIASRSGSTATSSLPRRRTCCVAWACHWTRPTKHGENCKRKAWHQSRPDNARIWPGMPTPLLFEPISFRSVAARNRIVVAPMCQYSANDGLGDDWHIQHLGARAMGGAGIVFTEATHVSAIGRITPYCLGLWNGQHQALLTR